LLNTPFPPWPSFTEIEADKAKHILLSNKVNYWTGTECRSFEKEFAQYTDCSYAVAVSNGTLALDLAFVALGIKHGDEVIVTSRTFLASVSSIVNCGATPVFVDISADTQNITPEAIRAAITEKTSAIVCVHLAGWACEMDEIIQIASDNDLFVVEDCAQAHGAKYKGRSVGSIGHVGCWSFCQDKIMTTGGEGGMVTTNDENLWKKMWSYKDHGKSYDTIYHKEHPPGFRWLHESFGTNWRMTEIQGAIGRYQLTQMPLWTQKRNDNQNAIWECAKTLNGLRVPKFQCASCSGCDDSNKCVHAAYKCYVFVEQEQLNEGWDRDRIIDEAVKRGVPCFSGSCSEVYLEKAFDNTAYRPQKRLPVAKELGETSLMFLVHPTLTQDEIELTCKVLSDVMHEAANQS
jgi:dTDP-4-amino-4,6-dideoxygalactose transaminase